MTILCPVCGKEMKIIAQDTGYFYAKCPEGHETMVPKEKKII
jgi:ssDNA-binding Zn-finger/Zn-ribbon topoisomerase 1